MITYKTPKAKEIFVVYDVDDPDDYIAYRTLEKATADMEVGDGDVVAVYTLTALVDVEVGRKVKAKRIKI